MVTPRVKNGNDRVNDLQNIIQEHRQEHRLWIESQGSKGKAADFRGRGTELAQVKELKSLTGLSQDAFAGADLRFVELPERIEDFGPLVDRAKDAGRQSRSLFVSLLSACGFAILTVWNLTDSNLIVQGIPIALPGVGANIPAEGLLYLAPLLLCVLYAWLRVRLWRFRTAMAGLPRVLPDGTEPAQAVTDSWAVFGRRSLSVTILLGWSAATVPVIYIWGKALAKHSGALTTVHVVLSVGLAVALCAELPPSVAGMKRQALTRATPLALLLCLSWLSLKAFHTHADCRYGSSKSTDFLFYHPVAWRIQAPGVALSGADLRKLRGLGLACGNLSGATLTGANLSGLDLSETNFSQANLDGANLSCADLTGAKLAQAKLQGANLAGANLSKTNFSQANLEGARLSEPNSGYDGAQCQPSGVSPRRKFDGPCETKLSGWLLASFGEEGDHRLALAGAALAHADLTGLDLSRADLFQADLSGARLVCANLQGANLSGAKMVGAEIESAALQKAQLSAADLTDADLHEADLSGADLTRAKLVRAKLNDGKSLGVNLSGVDLTRSDLSNLDLRGAQFTDANFKETVLTKVKLFQATGLRASSLLGACGEGDLEGVDILERTEKGEQPTAISEQENKRRLIPCPKDLAAEWFDTQERAAKAKNDVERNKVALDREKLAENQREADKARPLQREQHVGVDSERTNSVDPLVLRNVGVIYRPGAQASATKFYQSLKAAGIPTTMKVSNFSELTKPYPEGAVQVVNRQGEMPLGQKVRDIIGEGTVGYTLSGRNGTVQVWVF